MTMKSITFRCSDRQNERISHALRELACNRTELITTALESFLAYAEQPHIRQADLFSLVAGIDACGGESSFAEQA